MDRFTTAVVGGVLVLIVAGLGAAVIVRSREQPPDLTTPSGVVLAYALAEQRGDASAAWDLLASSAQQRTTRDQFISRVGLDNEDRSYLATEGVQTDSDGASVVLLRTSRSSEGLFGSSSYTSRSTVRLAREPDGWRITVPHDDYVLTKR
jgi:hypothetical protein